MPKSFIDSEYSYIRRAQLPPLFHLAYHLQLAGVIPLDQLVELQMSFRTELDVADASRRLVRGLSPSNIVKVMMRQAQ